VSQPGCQAALTAPPGRCLYCGLSGIRQRKVISVTVQNAGPSCPMDPMCAQCGPVRSLTRAPAQEDQPISLRSATLAIVILVPLCSRQLWRAARSRKSRGSPGVRGPAAR